MVPAAGRVEFGNDLMKAWEMAVVSATYLIGVAATWLVLCLLWRGDEFTGPVLCAEAARRLAAGELSSDALVWTATATGWRPASEALGEGAARPAPAGPDPAPDPAGVARVEEPARPAPAREAAAPVGAESTRARFCIRCGAPFADDARFCVRCGRERR